MEFKTSGVVLVVLALVLTAGQLRAQASSRCGGQLNQQNGVITSPNYPERYSNYESCFWTITAKENEVIDIQFSKLDLEGTETAARWGNGCPDYVEIYDGDSRSSPRIRTMCRTKTSSELAQIITRSTGNKMLVVFISDYDGQRSGFVASYWTHVCPPFTFGYEACNKSCNCVMENTASCNSTNGNCICKNGWQSADCSHDIDECSNPRTEPCPFDYRECVNTAGSFHCPCKGGLIESDGQCTVNSSSVCGEENTCSHLCVSISTQSHTAEEHCYCPTNMKLMGNTCQACSNVAFGNDCRLGCNCVPQNTQSCDVTNGGCICSSGYTSADCSRDIDECTELNVKVCPSPAEQCVNTRGSYECRCNSGAPRSSSGSCEACSHTLTGLTGVIQSPNFPENAYDNARCNWTIIAENRMATILLSLSQVQMAQYDDYRTSCYYDALEVYDGNSSDAALLGRFCGYYYDTVNVQSTGNMMYLAFRTNTVRWTRRFNGTYSIREYQAFRSNLTAPTGIITSPGYPASYLHNVVSTWTISVASGNVVTFSFTDFQLGKLGQDYLEVYDGSHPGTRRIAQFYDSNSPNKISSSNNNMHITYSSSNATIERGFNGSYITDACKCYWWNTESCNSPTGPCVCKTGFTGVSCDSDIYECQDDPCPAHSQCLNTYGSFSCYCWNGTQVAANSLCNDWETILGNQSGEIKSQNYPAFYPRNVNYTWTYRGKPNTVVSLRFRDLDLEESYGKCYYDYVEVYDQLALVGRYCGKDIPTLLRTNGSDMSLIFKTNDYNWYGEYKGFQAVYYSHVCPKFHYGEEACSRLCPCDFDRTRMCDNINGFCFCQPGYVGRGCSIDVNECLDPDVCPDNSECINDPGTYTCECLPGYVRDDVNGSCTESSSCSEQMKQTCSHLCDVDPDTNQETCFCPEGLVLQTDQVTCVVPLYPYGPDAADFEVHQSSDSGFPPPGDSVELGSLIAVGNSLTSTFSVLRNGVITFNGGKIRRIPKLRAALEDKVYLLAPFWTEKGSNTAGQVYYHVYEKCGPSVFGEPDINAGPSPMKQEVLARITRDVKQFHSLPDFDISVVIVVTWEDVQPKGCPDNFRNTFQVILVSGHIPSTSEKQIEADERTYAIFIYKDGDGICKLLQPIEVGITTDKGVNSFQVDKNSPKMAQLVGNTGYKGVVTFEVGKVVDNSLKCQRYLCNHAYLISNQYFQAEIDQLYKCPCSLEALGLQWQSFKDVENTKSYTISPIAKHRLFKGNRRNKICNYLWTPPESDSWEDWQKSWLAGSFIPSGHFLISDPWPSFGNTYSSKDGQDNIDARSWCCENSPYKFCHRFYKLFGDHQCTNQPTFVPASALGDPVISSLDGLGYTMNGEGEYVMLIVPSQNFTFQVRTQRQEVGGKLSNGTVFTAGAAQDEYGANFQVQLLSNQKMAVFANGMEFTQKFYSDKNFVKITPSMSVQRRNEAKRIIVVATFSCGVSIKVHVNVQSLGIEVEVDNSLKNKTQGLLGVFNGDPADDLLSSDGTLLPANSTERQILEIFAKSYMITKLTSVFTYDNGESTDDYQHPEFVPEFIDEADSGKMSEAKAVCGEDNKGCIGDFIATKNADFARNTKQGTEIIELRTKRLKNSPPRIRLQTNLDNNYWVVLEGKQNNITVLAEDDDENDDVACELAENIDGISLSHDGIITYTPDLHRPIELSLRARDSKEGYSPILTLTILVCPHCNNHGTCNVNVTRAQFLAGKFRILKCVCFPAYDGDNCEMETDGCKLSPCSAGQKCSDLTAAEQGNSSVGYKCGSCPAGTREVNRLCEDINECIESAPCDQHCLDTFGSYQCSCRTGFRLDLTDKSMCKDVNECDEGTSGCEHICENTLGSYTCACRTGYTLSNDTRACIIDSNVACTQCDQICTTVNNEAGCACNLGYKIDTSDPTKCADIDECNNGGKSPCSQICVNTIGRFECSCYPGFRLAADGVSCVECESLYFGEDCSNTCDCRGRGTCDKVRGCVCDKPWTGAKCDKYVDECADANACPAGLICHNGIGSFTCDCLDGYRKENDSCSDIDECSDYSNRCDPSLEDCINIIGSYICNCKEGYTRDLVTGLCVDINECDSHIDGCEQTCENGPGGYRCRCNAGYALADNRLSCVKNKEVCSLNCSYGCIFDSSGASNCFCPRGYKQTGTNSYDDIDECSSDSDNQCDHKDRCINTLGGYKCSCEEGYRLENDGTTCTACSIGTWGNQCNNSCACGIGAISCDKVTGCTCKPGYTGVHCENVIDRCASGEVTCQPTEQCVMLRGSSVCACRSGYAWINGQCRDQNECQDPQLNSCKHVCTNTEGSHFCSCFPGFSYNSSTNTCSDIDECQNPGLHNCDHVCNNNEGSYTCSCNIGYNLDPTTNNCNDINECQKAGLHNCDQVCSNNEGSYTCSCNFGYNLDTSTNNCSDINECQNPWLHNCDQVCNNNEGSYTCSCNIGYNLDPTTNNCSDEDECIDKTKNECNQICTNTEGSYACSCDNGYNLDSAAHKCYDVDECQNSTLNDCQQVCTNTDGGFACSCLNGYLYNYTANTCHDIDECQNATLHNCQQVCINTDGGFSCSCLTGYLYNYSTNTCHDIDECLTGNVCSSFTKCRNLDGRFECLCWNGLHVGSDGTCEDCNRTLTERTGYFMTSNHPGLYPSNSHCIWDIKISDPDAIIELSFLSYEVEGCPFDYTTIYNNEIVSALPTRICNKVKKTVTSKGNNLRIVFTSDARISKSGFLASYTSYLPCKQKTCSHTCIVVSSNPRIEECQCPSGMKLDSTNDYFCVNIHECNTVITEPTGTLVSKNYPEKYPANSNCHWILQGGHNSIITLSFASFTLETSYQCSFDYVRVYDGSGEAAQLLGNFCGKTVPANITSSGNTLYVKFKSNAFLSYQGFRITYTIHGKNM